MTLDSLTNRRCQGRFSPAAIKLKQLIASDRIGRVLSSEVHASGGGKDRVRLSNGAQYFTDRKIGGNVFTIGYGHCKLCVILVDT